MNSDKNYAPFSQRFGYAAVPDQLRVGEITNEFRRQVNYYVELEIERNTAATYYDVHFNEGWRRLTKDLHVLFLGRPIGQYVGEVGNFRDLLAREVAGRQFYDLFDLIEFLANHQGVSTAFLNEMATAFVNSRLAYRLIDRKVVAIGSDEQATAFVDAISSSETFGALAARSHLLSAGKQLRDGNWSASVRESIHAVEAIARKLEPTANTLGDAMKKLRKEGNVHAALESALLKLYGYTNAKEGIRHALVFQDVADVDEADALFMLGACSAFVSYLIAKA